MNWPRVGGIVGFLSISAAAVAGPVTYECDVLTEQNITEEGKFEPGLDLYIGKKFHVERSTGTVLGGGLSNSAYPAKTVIDPGSDKSSFKLIWVSAKVTDTKAAHHAAYLEIKEWESGRLKPFILVESGTVLTGTCE